MTVRQLLVLAALAAAPAALAAQQGPPTALLMRGPEVGRRAPDFALPWATKDTVGTAGAPFQLWKNLGRVTVLAFYPRDFSSGCTAELRTFTEQFESLFGPDVTVVGISTDSVETHQRFAASLGAPFMLLSDPSQAVARKYGANGDAAMRRVVYVIGKDGKVAYRDLRFGALDPKAYEALRAAVREARR